MITISIYLDDKLIDKYNYETLPEKGNILSIEGEYYIIIEVIEGETKYEASVIIQKL